MIRPYTGAGENETGRNQVRKMCDSHAVGGACPAESTPAGSAAEGQVAALAVAGAPEAPAAPFAAEEMALPPAMKASATAPAVVAEDQADAPRSLHEDIQPGTADAGLTQVNTSGGLLPAAVAGVGVGPPGVPVFGSHAWVHV